MSLGNTHDTERLRAPALTAVQWQRVLVNLLLVQAMLLLPVAMMLPSWLILVPMITGYWQWQVIRGRQRALPRVLKWALVLGAPPLLLLSGLHPGALDFYVSLAFIGVALKLIEMKSYRDAFLIAMLALFVLAALLLLDQGIFFAVYVFAGASLALAALVRLHAPQGLGIWQAWRASGRALIIAVPFMLLLFVAFPRLPPIWQMPTASDVARTGLSDTMAPGDIAELVQSNELVFRSRFFSDAPNREDLYWRAMTLNYFDGTRWFQWDRSQGVPRNLVGQPRMPEAGQNSVEWDYEVALSATRQPWVATLEDLTGYSGGDLLWLADNRLAWRGNLTQAQGFRAQSARQAEPEFELDDRLRAAALQLPSGGNTDTRALAATWREDVNGDARQFADRVMQYFVSQPFQYTLRPGAAGDSRNAIDQFLFTSQRGFCAHYAEAMVFLARAADIPARVVTGYLGGQWNTDGSYLVVRAQEAHAWAELWIEGEGWVRYDPTMMVAPDRVDLSLSEVLQEEQDLRPAAWSDGSVPGFLQQLYWQWDSMQYQWQRWVLNFDDSDRQSLLQEWWGDRSLGQTLAWVGGTILLVFSFWFAVLRWGHFWRFWSLAALERRARHYCLSRASLPAHEGLTHWVARLQPDRPDMAQALAEFADSYLPLRYGKASVSREDKQRVRQRLGALKQACKADRRSVSERS